MKPDTIHKLDEFPQLQWNVLEPESCGSSWSYGRGGHGFKDYTWTLSILRADSSADIWELPDALGSMLQMAQRIGADNVRRAIHLALDYGHDL